MQSTLPMLRRAALAAALLHACCAAHAQAVADPTRPAGAAAPGGVTGSGSEAPVAQIVVTGKGRGFVVVDGQMVRVGQTYEGLKLVAIGPQGPVWQREGARRIVSTTPGVVKSEAGSDRGRGTVGEKSKRSNTGEKQ
jgi:hypothetical protein